MQERKNELELDMPKVIEFTKLSRIIRLKNDEGDASVLIVREGKNISGNAIYRLRTYYDSEMPLKEETLKCTFNKQEIFPTVKSLQQEVIRGGGGIGNVKKIWHNLIYLTPPEPLASEKNMESEIQFDLVKEYVSGFNGEGATEYHSIFFKTKEIELMIEAPDGYYFISKDFRVIDMNTDLEVYKENNRIVNECLPFFSSNQRK